VVVVGPSLVGSDVVVVPAGEPAVDSGVVGGTDVVLSPLCGPAFCAGATVLDVVDSREVVGSATVVDVDDVVSSSVVVEGSVVVVDSVVVVVARWVSALEAWVGLTVAQWSPMQMVVGGGSLT